MTNPTIDHPVWGAIEVLQDGGSYILCQVGAEAKKVSKAWLVDKGVLIDHLFKEPEAPSRPRQRSSGPRSSGLRAADHDEDKDRGDSDEEAIGDEDTEENETDENETDEESYDDDDSD